MKKTKGWAKKAPGAEETARKRKDIVMDFFIVITLLGGLAMFLYGMNMLGSGLEKISGGRLEKALEKLTSSVLSGVLFGALVTAAVQSSGATTVIVVGLVNARILQLRQAIGVIMGANIGTTITAHILRLAGMESDNLLVRFLSPQTLASVFIIIGVLLFMSSKRKSRKDIGQILVGFGLLFTGMLTMSGSVEPLAGLPIFAQLFATLENPVLGVLAGALITALLQSSSASVGILQALSNTGVITYASAFPIIMGQNIGTCSTPLIASIGATKNAKRAACVHLTFNVLGTALFLGVTYIFQYTVGFPFWNQPIDMGGIADFHTLFNVVVTLIFLPFTRLLEKLVCFLIKEDAQEAHSEAELEALDDRLLVSPGLALDYSHKATVQMGRLALENFRTSVQQFEHFDQKAEERMREQENVIDKLESRLGTYLLKLSECELTDPESKRLNELLQVISEFERIGDYSMNNAQYAMNLFEEKITLSPNAMQELKVTSEACEEIIALAISAFDTEDTAIACNIEPLEQIIDLMEKTLKDRHVLRLREGSCTVQSGIAFVETLASLERIADHCSNIGVHVITHMSQETDIDRHDYLREVHMGASQTYAQLYKQYDQKYYTRIDQAKG